MVNESADKWFSALIKFHERDSPVTSITVYPHIVNLVWDTLHEGGEVWKLDWSPLGF